LIMYCWVSAQNGLRSYFKEGYMITMLCLGEWWISLGHSVVNTLSHIIPRATKADCTNEPAVKNSSNHSRNRRNRICREIAEPIVCVRNVP
jgi:hypothetical protein